MTEHFIPAPTKYTHLKGNPDPSTLLRTGLVYDAICKTLSARQEQVDWASFTQDDWQLFARMAETEGVAPLLHWIRKTGGKDKGGRGEGEWPTEVREFLQASYYKTAAQNALLFQELERILAALEAAQIPVIVLKGAALAQTIYANPGLRPMGDLDLLVRQGQLKNALKVMQTLSYQPTNPEHSPGMRALMTYDIALRSSQHDHFPIELHWQLIASRGDWREPDLTWLWDHLESHPLPTEHTTVEMPYLDPVAHLLFLAAHLKYKHDARDARLLWFFDIDQMVQKKIETHHYDQLAVQAEAFIWSPALAAALAQTNQLFETPLPLDWLDQLKRKPLDPRAVQLLAQRAGLPTTRSVEMWHRIQAQKGSKKLALIGRLIFPTPHYMRQRYQIVPGWLWPFYYPYRWLDMAMDLVKTSFRRLPFRENPK